MLLIPESCGSVDPSAIEFRPNDAARSTREVAGGIVREGDLIRHDESETGWAAVDHGETSRVRRPRLAAPLLRLPAGTLPRDRVRVLKQWEGVVTERTTDSFFADLQDLADLHQPLEVVEIPFEEIPEDDRSLVVEGAVFYWSIGYETSPGGTLRRISEIRVRRTPRWTKRTLQQVKRRAEEMFEQYGR